MLHLGFLGLLGIRKKPNVLLIFIWEELPNLSFVRYGLLAAKAVCIASVGMTNYLCLPFQVLGRVTDIN